MSDTQTHLVRKQLIELHLDQKEGAFDIQDRVRKFFVSDINPALDEACSRLVGPDEFIQIDKLEIELGLINVHQIERDFAPRVCRHLMENLADRVGLLRHEEALIQKTERAIRGSPPGEPGRVDDRKISEIDYHLQLLQFFLQTGNLPWYQETLTPFSPENIFPVVLQKAPGKSKALLEDELRHPVSRQRLIYQFSDDLLVEVAGLLEPGGKDEIQKWLIDLAIIGKIVEGIDITIPEIRLSFWDSLISGLQSSSWRRLAHPDMSKLLLSSTIFSYPDAGKAMLGVLQQAVDRLIQSGIKLISPLPKIIEQQIQNLESHGPPGAIEDQTTEPRADDSKDPAPLDRQRPDTFSLLSKQGLSPAGQDNWMPEDLSAQPLPSETDGIASEPEKPFSRAGRFAADENTPDRFQAEDTAALQEVYVKNAGLVLLWPYFNNLFKQFKLLNETGFADNAAGDRAIHLLQYLATGKQEAAEFELPLNKLFCGRDLQTPLNKYIRISAEEQAECRKLLTAAIAHWAALKKTSIENFRASFLIRNGLLQKKDNGWHLTIEPRAYDLLLQRLPWGISLIKLSWMPNMLTVEWH